MQLRGAHFLLIFRNCLKVSFMHDAKVGDAHHEIIHMLISQP